MKNENFNHWPETKLRLEWRQTNVGEEEE